MSGLNMEELSQSVLKPHDLASLFDSMIDEKYTIIKISDAFPNLAIGSDLDIFCQDPQRSVQIILNFLNRFVDNAHSVEITKIPGKIKVDFCRSSQIILRFDIYIQLPLYTHLNLRTSYFDVIIENSILREMSGVNVKVPSIEDDLILRYIEYIEYFSVVPDKIKHVDYICQKFQNDIKLRSLFFQKLHYYVKAPEIVTPKQTYAYRFKRSAKYALSLCSKAIYVYKHYGMFSLVQKVRERYKS